MASKSTPVAAQSTDYETAVKAVMAQLRAPATVSGPTLLSRFESVAVDSLADSGEFVARLAAGAVSGFDSAKDAYQIERERQLRRRAEKLLRAHQ